MNLNQLKIFYFAAKNSSLSAAAQELFITQPAVTKGIQRLQEHYEIKFVDFVGKKLVLTDAGEVLYQIAEKIFELENQAEESIRDFQQRKRGFPAGKDKNKGIGDDFCFIFMFDDNLAILNLNQHIECRRSLTLQYSFLCTTPPGFLIR